MHPVNAGLTRLPFDALLISGQAFFKPLCRQLHRAYAQGAATGVQFRFLWNEAGARRGPTILSSG